MTIYPLGRASEALDGVPLIFEGVPEVLDAKERAFAITCEHAAADAIIASTTSTMMVDELAAFVTGRERFLNAHWLS